MPRYLGPEVKNALLIECGPTVVGNVIVVRHPGVGGFGQVVAQSLADNSVLGRHLVALDALLFGLGIDGESVLTTGGTTPDPVTGATRSGSTWSLVRDISVAKLHVMDGVTLKTKGYRIVCRDALVLYGSAVIHNDGAVGGTATGWPGGIKSATTGAGTLGAGGTGNADGGAGGLAANGNGASGADTTDRFPSRGGKGGKGGFGVSVVGHGSGGLGGNAGTISVSPHTPDSFAFSQLLLDTSTLTMIQGGSTGGSGGGGGATAANNGGGGGAGGSGGGPVVISCGQLLLVNWTGRISADGGNGGRGAGGVGGSGDGGGGGGGGGGAVLLLARQLPLELSLSSIHADGGLGGAQVGAAQAGFDGAAGLVLVFNLSAPKTPTTYLTGVLELPQVDNLPEQQVEEDVAAVVEQTSLFYVRV